MSGGNQSVAHSALVKLVTEYLQLRGAWTLKVLGGLGQRPGMPDILACIGGRLIAVEVKTGHAVMTQGQQEERLRMEQAGALYVLARDLETVEDALLGAGLVARGIVQRRVEGGRHA